MTIGIDGCKSGWVAALQQSGEIRLEVFPDLDQLWQQYGPTCTLLLIDMPIGVSDGGPEGRSCDRLARRMLSPRRHSSVFTPPCRQALYAPILEASAVNYQLTGKKLSRQTINIMPKMREVDQWLRNLPPTARQRIRESHPEVVFTALNSGTPLFFNKKSKEGQSERLNLLEQHHPGMQEILKEAQNRILRKTALTDDLIDALVLGIASKIATGSPDCGQSLPHPPPLDAEGLRMEIFYVNP
ncbi:DUF429 domain-containing protein [Flavilitoribacter nigricans]|uniref:DUF429 domain-containing protein n=1 Tax=Flavilitoribacter nigricans (strain ATCC 23147 / DSM 23189 / NBRC 102662 / NCIMB 1420 / SS-2) TaxID=1122177 RepID=A0A2D0N3P5_FLAN2|nr:DUF429 domain-containing protein [Flavilitoribacter nigricans]PHN03125.1 hypothetical protein CRP01_29030 [Flavilitoribacter nigricans DSM 23189 = NBRC 102662]